MSAAIQPVRPVHSSEEDFGLPGWIYHDQEFFELEKRSIFRTSWQLVCHSNDIPEVGDYHCFELLGEAVVTVRGKDSRLRSFHNVCRHRASRLFDGPKGNCGNLISCPYHHWSYSLEGKLVGVPQRASFHGLDMENRGLAVLEQEIYMGFVFVRFEPGLPSVREMMAPYEQELAAYRMEELVPQGRVTLRPRQVNWKNVADNYSDGMHIPVAHLPLERQRLWAYLKLWPNVAFDIYPDQIDFMQFIPVSPTQTLIREIAYVHPDSRREMRAARYLNWRINRRVNIEDKTLIERVQAGMASSSFSVGPLSENEVCLRSFARRMRRMIPECRKPTK